MDINQIELRDLAEYRRLKTPEVPLSEMSTETYRELSQTNDPYSYAEQMPTPTESIDNLDLTDDDEENLAGDSLPDVVEEEVIRLLEERLVVNLNKRKVGEVIVRKEVETRMVEVPVQYEKLIVEQVGPEQKRIAEIDLSQPEISGLAMPASDRSDLDNQPIARGMFTSPKTASLLLDAIARQKNHGCQKVRVEVVLQDSEHQETYQEWFDRCSGT